MFKMYPTIKVWYLNTGNAQRTQICHIKSWCCLLPLGGGCSLEFLVCHLWVSYNHFFKLPSSLLSVSHLCLFPKAELQLAIYPKADHVRAEQFREKRSNSTTDDTALSVHWQTGGHSTKQLTSSLHKCQGHRDKERQRNGHRLEDKGSGTMKTM